MPMTTEQRKAAEEARIERMNTRERTERAESLHETFEGHSPSYDAAYERYGALMPVSVATRWAWGHGTTLEALRESGDLLAVDFTTNEQVSTAAVWSALGY